MTHDPLCYIEYNPLVKECRTCDLIARVREDERSMKGAVVIARAAAQDGYAAAVSDAAEALRHMPWHRPWGSDDPYQYLILSDAVAEIEALGGER